MRKSVLSPRSVVRLLAASAFALGLCAAATAEAETYAYDQLGRLIQVTADNGTVTHYCYDAAGNRTYVGPTACS